jgi:hypothetical protein
MPNPHVLRKYKWRNFGAWERTLEFKKTAKYATLLIMFAKTGPRKGKFFFCVIGQCYDLNGEYGDWGTFEEAVDAAEEIAKKVKANLTQG